MFRQYANSIPEGANQLFLQHPSVLTELLEVAWQFRAHDLDEANVGRPSRRSNIPQLPDFWLNPRIQAAGIAPPPNGPVVWDHLIYAYMIENTRIYEIFRRVLHEFLHGEKLGVPRPEAQQWLRNTEELFYRDPPPFSITTITSHIRSDTRASRRNAYQRMFGRDLIHGTDDGQPYPYVKADTYNNEFVATFEELLRESWVAIANRSNTSGSNPTDRSKIENLVENLNHMLMSRRLHGNLSREEFVAVSMMSWFHLTVSFNSPIIEDLRANAISPEQRLFQVAQRVGLPAHGLSKCFFDIADAISRLLIEIEASGTAIVATLAPNTASGQLNDIQTIMSTVITHWSSITGRDLKARKIAVQ